ncbi:MAG: carotenoid oxygenase family protein [Candidatus Obscuribacterales bacterium]|nr:carotenoid oxygenase family protein [Candidatus Obscuribacterales bacterium]
MDNRLSFPHRRTRESAIVTSWTASRLAKFQSGEKRAGPVPARQPVCQPLIRRVCQATEIFLYRSRANLSIERIKAIFSPKPSDNTKVNIGYYSRRYLALTETFHLNKFSLDDLAYLDPYKFYDNPEGQITTAHPQFDTQTGQTYVVNNTISSQRFP